MARKERFNNQDDLLNKLICINRVTKVVKGGRTMRFAALIVVGDGQGSIGLGMGKAGEVPEAIRKATAEAKRNMIKIATVNTSVPHEAIGCFGSSKVIIMPASEGTGVIAGGAVRDVLELAGINDILTKCIGSRTPINMVRATVNALKSLKTIEEVAALRGKKPEEIRG